MVGSETGFENLYKTDNDITSLSDYRRKSY